MKKDFLKLSDLTKSEALDLLKKAKDLKEMRIKGIPHQPLKGKSLGMIFNKNSTRTRISFEVGMFELGGHSLFLTPDQRYSFLSASLVREVARLDGDVSSFVSDSVLKRLERVFGE